MSTTTLIIDDRSPDIIYIGLESWFRDGTWTASDGQSGTLSGTNDPAASLQFTFPVPAIAFRYFGMKRSHGGLYGICVDCDPDHPSFETINAFDPTDDGTNPPSLLFSQTFSSPAVHVIIIHNQEDPNGTPPGNSQLTIDRFELDIPASPASTSTITIVQTSIAVNTPTEATPAASGSSSQVSPTTNTFLNTSSLVLGGSTAVGSPQTQLGSVSAVSSPSSTFAAGDIGSNGTLAASPSVSITSTPGDFHTSSHGGIIGGAIGGAVGGLAVIAILIFLNFRLRTRKQATSIPATVEHPGMVAVSRQPPFMVSATRQPPLPPNL